MLFTVHASDNICATINLLLSFTSVLAVIIFEI